MKLDQDTACRLYNLINDGPPVGVGTDNEVITNTTSLGTAIHLIGRPTHVRRAERPGGKSVERTLPNGVKYNDRYFWDAKEAANFLREWANAMDPLPTPEEPTC